MAVAFPSGTKVYFVGTTVSTGWTRDPTSYDHILRLTNGTWGSGGSTNFSSTFTSRPFTATAPFSPLTSGSTTLGPTTLPSHTHTMPAVSGPVQNKGTSTTSPYPLSGAATTKTTAAIGNPSPTIVGHTHPFGTIAASINGTVNMAVKYVDAFIAIKD